MQVVILSQMKLLNTLACLTVTLVLFVWCNTKLLLPTGELMCFHIHDFNITIQDSKFNWKLSVSESVNRPLAVTLFIYLLTPAPSPPKNHTKTTYFWQNNWMGRNEWYCSKYHRMWREKRGHGKIKGAQQPLNIQAGIHKPLGISRISKCLEIPCYIYTACKTVKKTFGLVATTSTHSG